MMKMEMKKKVEWPEAKQAMEDGKIVAKPFLIGGFFFFEISKGVLFSYNQFCREWENEDIERLNSIYSQEVEVSKEYGDTPTK